MMSEKKIETPNLLFEGQPVIDVVRRCNEVIGKHADGGRLTEKGLNEHGFELILDFIWALGLEVSISVEDMKEET